MKAEIRNERRALRNIRRQAEREEQAFRRTVKRTADWATGRAARAIANAHGLPLRAITRGRTGIAGRVRKHINADRGEASIWIGTSPIKAGYVGRLRQTSTGAQAALAGGKGWLKFPGSFVARMRSGHRGIFGRASSLARHSQSRSDTPPKPHWDPNLPIKEETIELTRAERALAPVRRGIPERFRQLWEQQARFRRGGTGRR